MTEILPSARWFEGHFEGDPILPAIAQLLLVRDALRAHLGLDDCEVAFVTGVRFRRLVRPGERLGIALGDARLGLQTRFELRCGEALVAGGAVTAAAGRACPGRGNPSRARAVAPATWPEPARLIPQRPPALLVDRILELSEAGLRAQGRIPAASPFAEQGHASALAALELGAQAAACLEAIVQAAERDRAGPRIGYLVGIRSATLVRPLAVDSPLDVTVRLAAAAPPLSTFELEVHDGADLCASGCLSTYLTDARVL